ncbi:MAG: hypothetical protein KJ734_08925, partial [Chloroflexi bacterium]|nr:hypothetical protein [Chloroflexota bacterium]
VRPWWRWLLGGGLALEAAIAALLLWLNWPLASSFAQGLVPTAVIDAAGRQVTDGIGAWASWLGAQAALVQAQWQAFSAQVSSLAPASPAPELVVQAIILLAAVLAVWVAGNRVLATISIQ